MDFYFFSIMHACLDHTHDGGLSFLLTILFMVFELAFSLNPVGQVVDITNKQQKTNKIMFSTVPCINSGRVR